MAKTWAILAIWLLVGVVDIVHGITMTEAQVAAAAKVIRNVCQPKTKATNEQIDNMHKGMWNGEPEVKCYMGCVAQMMKMIKGGKLQYEQMMKQIDTLPENYRARSKEVFTKCKDAITNPDKCEAGYEMTKCMYFEEPDRYFLP